MIYKGKSNFFKAKEAFFAARDRKWNRVGVIIFCSVWGFCILMIMVLVNA